MGKLAEAVKATPPISVTGLKLVGIPLSEWVLALTAVYTMLLIVHKSIQVIQSVRAKPDDCHPKCHERRCRAGDTP